MSSDISTLDWGRRVYGAGIIALGAVALAWRDFDLGQPVPKSLPERTTLACAVAALTIAAGAAIEWRRIAAWAASALAAYYILVVVVLMYGHLAFAHYAEYGTYSGAAEQLAIGTGALIVFATKSGKIDSVVATKWIRGAQIVFGVCALLFGGAHFFYMGLTAPLVPKWLPPSQMFWAYLTGFAHIAAGLAIITGVGARLASILLTIMFAMFTFLVHAPMLFADPASRTILSENAENLALIGVAWLIAESFAAIRPADSSMQGQRVS
ncbi:MAG: DoxX family protein [Alphaproteobacteria bacterium]|nr:DoxX family protein [Alphaproteobacteria bacterium]